MSAPPTHHRLSHQLSNGMFVSGPPDPPKPLPSASLPSLPLPFTGTPPSRSKSHSGPLPRKSSGPLSLIPPTGLITSSRFSSDPPELSPSVSTRKKKPSDEYGPAVSVVGERGFVFGVSRVWGWVLAAMFVLGLGAGVFVWVAVGRMEILVGVAAVMAIVVAVVAWNWARASKELERFLRCFDNTVVVPRDLPVGKLVKITGHVTCGSLPLETSYQNVSRCIYTSTELYEYRGLNGISANNSHKHFTWGLRYAEKHVADFYISDSKTGTRFLIRAGNGAKVSSFVKPATLLDINEENREQSPEFLSWLTDHNLSSDNRIMRLREGYIKEGDTASVLGILRKHENLILIDPPTDAISTGCQWRRCFFPMFVEGLVLIGEESPDEVVYQV